MTDNNLPPKPNYPIPTMPELEQFLTDYGWHFRKVQPQPDQPETLIAPLGLNEKDAVLVSFHIQGEFLLVNTVGLFKDVPLEYAPRFLVLNDSVKLCKFFATPAPDQQHVHLDLAFELWAEAWNKTTFFAFMDMLALAAEKTYELINQNNIPHTTSLIQFGNSSGAPATPPDSPPQTRQ